MPATLTTKSKPDLERALDAAGEKEYRRLLRALRMARGSFFLFPIESDFPNVLRDLLLKRLGDDLADEGICLRIVALNRRQWDVFAAPELETPVVDTDVVVLVGLEDTPQIVPEPGRKPVRPPALALLNQQREALHSRIEAPFLVWCPPYVFTALMEQAPDFFDHFTSLFRFHNAAPERVSVEVTTPTPETTRNNARNREPVFGSREAIAFYEQQVAQFAEPTEQRARVLLGLAQALLDWRGPDSVQCILRASQIVEEALTLLSIEHTPYEWARGKNIEGNVYSELTRGDHAANIQQAITCYKAALRVRTEADFPFEWAMTQNNLGNAYRDLPTGDRAANIQQAITCYQAALRVRTEADFPYEWAGMQNNLGNAYDDLPTGDRAANIQQAITCYKAALRVRTEADFPYEWAMTQNNLGILYHNLPSGDRAANLQRAIACYEAAVRVRTEADFPMDYGDSHLCLGNAYADLGEIERAQEHFRLAVQGYAAAGLPPEWEWRAYAEERLRELD